DRNVTGVQTCALPISLEFMGTGSIGSDYLDVIIRRGQEASALKALAECLAATNRAVELEQVRIGGSCAADLGKLLGDGGWSLGEEQTNISRHIDLSGQSWPAYLGTLGRAHRYNFNRRLRQLGREFTIRCEKVSTEAQRRAALGRLIA